MATEEAIDFPRCKRTEHEYQNKKSVMDERFANREEERAFLCRYINDKGGPLEILEAGCGWRWPLTLSVPYRLTGIDRDADALKRRGEISGDLAESIVADLVQVEQPSAKYDVIYCSYVLEHVVGVERVLENFTRWLKPGGLMILRVPDRDCVYGVVTRLTPHWTHVLYKRWIMGNVNAGKPGCDPFPVVHEKVISRAGIQRFAGQHDLILKEVRTSGNHLRNPLVRIVSILISILSTGRLPWRHNNLCFVLKKP